jgi:hypothetical protein
MLLFTYLYIPYEINDKGIRGLTITMLLFTYLYIPYEEEFEDTKGR